MKPVKKDPPKFDPKKLTPEQLKKIKSFAQPAKGNVKPSYPETYVIAGAQALKGATTVPGLMSKIGDKSKTDISKAARLFFADVAANEAVDYAEERKNKKK
jgi:hypothetical protein